MTKYKKQIFSVFAAGAMVLNIATPVLASTTIEISGNGTGSDNYTNVNQAQTSTVTQTNTANVTNTVNADAKTGGNEAKFNSGTVVVDTGKADVKTNVQNVLNTNSAEVDCCDQGDTNVTISDNGKKSDNVVVLDKTSTTTLTQDNNATVTNDVDAKASSGGNEANGNHGGDVTIITDKASADIDVATVANVNSASITQSGTPNPSASFIISGNGKGSDNYIEANLTKTTTVDQDNLADVDNDVDAKASSGNNEASFNHGGDVVIHAGKATVNADIDNAVNFNFADVDCGCTWGTVLAEISENGVEEEDQLWWGHRRHHDSTDSVINVNLTGTKTVGQGNDADVNNDLPNLDAKSGGNEAKFNHGSDSDTSVMTDEAKVDSNVGSSGNVNVLGSIPDMELSLDFAAVLAFLGL